MHEEDESNELFTMWMTQWLQRWIMDTDEWDDFEEKISHRYPDARQGMTVLVRRARCQLGDDARSTCVGDFILRRQDSGWERVVSWYAQHEPSPVVIDSIEDEVEENRNVESPREGEEGQ